MRLNHLVLDGDDAVAVAVGRFNRSNDGSNNETRIALAVNELHRTVLVDAVILALSVDSIDVELIALPDPIPNKSYVASCGMAATISIMFIKALAAIGNMAEAFG